MGDVRWVHGMRQVVPGDKTDSSMVSWEVIDGPMEGDGRESHGRWQIVPQEVSEGPMGNCIETWKVADSIKGEDTSTRDADSLIGGVR